MLPERRRVVHHPGAAQILFDLEAHDLFGHRGDAGKGIGPLTVWPEPEGAPHVWTEMPV